MLLINIIKVIEFRVPLFLISFTAKGRRYITVTTFKHFRSHAFFTFPFFQNFFPRQIFKLIDFLLLNTL